MFGYIIPDKPNLYMKDYALYKAIYCGICMTTGKKYGQMARLTTNYDVVFLSALIHNFKGVDLSATEKNCAMHPIKKRPIAENDDITEMIAGANVLLVYYNLLDDVLDEGGVKKKMACSRLRSAYKKAKKEYSQLDKVIHSQYDRLRSLEKSYSDSVDYLADPFSIMMRDIARIIIGVENKDIDTFAYHFGKWIYLIDAIDDLKKDFGRKQFNPFISAFKNYRTREQFLADNKAEIDFAINSTVSEIKNSYAKLKFTFNTDLTDNIVYRGINACTDSIMHGTRGKTPKI